MALVNPGNFCLLHIILILNFLFCTSVSYAESPDEIGERGIAEYVAGNLMDGMELLYQAGEAGYAPAQARLGYILDQSEENEEAFSWFQKAAQQNNAEGLYGLGSMHSKGEGTEENIEVAFKLISAAAKQNYLPAMRVCASAHENGGLGLEIDNNKALEWFTRAAELDDESSIRKLAEAYRYGHLGLTINLEAAVEWQALLEKDQPEY